jgi:hypothetical protein
MKGVEPSAWIASAFMAHVRPVAGEVDGRARRAERRRGDPVRRGGQRVADRVPGLRRTRRIDQAIGEFGRRLRPGNPRPGQDQRRGPRRSPFPVGEGDRPCRKPGDRLQDLRTLDGRRRALALQRIFVRVDRARSVVEQDQQQVDLDRLRAGQARRPWAQEPGTQEAGAEGTARNSGRDLHSGG